MLIVQGAYPSIERDPGDQLCWRPLGRSTQSPGDCRIATCITLCAMLPVEKSSSPRLPESATQLVRINPAWRRLLELLWGCMDSCHRVDCPRNDRLQKSTAVQ